MTKRAIPAVPKEGELRTGFDTALKENMEIIMGQRTGKVATLASTATLSDVISKVNEIIGKMQ